MARSLEKEWERIIRNEERNTEKMIRKDEKQNSSRFSELKQGISAKIPDKLINTINEGFQKAFKLIFSKGTVVIERTFKKEEMNLDFAVNDFRVNQRPNSKSLKQLDRGVKKSHRANTLATVAEGVGLGAMGIGLPDIPLFLAIILKGIYETATGYGYDYKEEKEQIFILKMIIAALSESNKRAIADIEVEKWLSQMDEEDILYDVDEEVRKASNSLTQALLLPKFIQGIFVIGIIGGAANPFIYQKIMRYVIRMYKKRYLNQKRISIKNERKTIL